MRILYLNPSGQLGGAEMSLLDILASLRAAKPDWTLGLIAGSEGPLLEKARQIGVEAKVLPFPPSLARLGDSALNRLHHRAKRRATLLKNLLWAGPQTINYLSALRREVAAFAPQLIHTNGFKMHILGAWARVGGVPLVWHVRDYVSRRRVMAHLLRWHAGRCAAVVANSQSAADDMRRVCGDSLKIVAVYNAIDLQHFTPAGAHLDLDALAGLPAPPGETVRVGLLGTLARWKGHDVFLQALAQLPPELPLRAYIVGGALYQTDGSQHSLAELQQMARDLNLGARIGFTGFISDAAAAMRSLDIVVHASSEPEPFGRVIVEGMACGRAVVASRAGGAREIINEGVDALGHTPGNAAELAECLARLVINKDLRSALGRAGRATAEHRFDQKRLAAELLPLYGALAGAEN